MRQRLVVVGGGAAGMSAAAQGRRVGGASGLGIGVLEQSGGVSYSACGIPYWVGDQVAERSRLIARTPAQFAAQDITVRTGTRAEEIDLAAGKLRTRSGDLLGWDRLVVATGGRPTRPPIPGLDAPGGDGGDRLGGGGGDRGAPGAGGPPRPGVGG